MVGPIASSVIIQLYTECKTSAMLLARSSVLTAITETTCISTIHVALLCQVTLPAHMMSILTFMIFFLELSAEQPVKVIKCTQAGWLLGVVSTNLTWLFKNTAACLAHRNKSTINVSNPHPDISHYLQSVDMLDHITSLLDTSCCIHLLGAIVISIAKILTIGDVL